ncbi:MAG: hypothetical protein AABY22_09710 [Nanoarchaeota archaeon]
MKTKEEIIKQIENKLDLMESLLDDLKIRVSNFVNISEHTGEMRLLINQIRSISKSCEGYVKVEDVLKEIDKLHKKSNHNISIKECGYDNCSYNELKKELSKFGEKK